MALGRVQAQLHCDHCQLPIMKPHDAGSVSCRACTAQAQGAPGSAIAHYQCSCKTQGDRLLLCLHSACCRGHELIKVPQSTRHTQPQQRPVAGVAVLQRAALYPRAGALQGLLKFKILKPQLPMYAPRAHCQAVLLLASKRASGKQSPTIAVAGTAVQASAAPHRHCMHAQGPPRSSSG